MMLRLFIYNAVLLGVLTPAAFAQTESLVSPDGRIEIAFKLRSHQPFYSVQFNGQAVLLDSPIGVVLKANPFADGFELVETEAASSNSTWQTVWGQNKIIRDHYNQVLFQLQERGPLRRRMDIVFRAYDDGIAYRYHFPTENGIAKSKIAGELSSFCFAENHSVWRPLSDVQVSGDIKLDSFQQTLTPVTVKVRDDCYVSLHEADVAEYPVCKLTHSDSATLRVNVTGSIAAGQSTSWRTIQITKDPAGLIESNLILNLNEPCAISDTRWIRPGVSLWDWRVHGAEVFDADGSVFTYGLTTESGKRFIDAAARLGVEYYLVDAGWYGCEYSAESDPTTWEPAINVPQLAAYAKSKGVGLWLYINDKALRRFDLDRTLSLYQKWGIAGIKHGFPTEKQFFCQKVVQKCAQYKLMYNCHEPVKPTGYSRTYPNYMTREFINSQLDGPGRPAATPTDICTFPFVHCLGGPLDRSPGMFSLNTMIRRTKCHKEIPSTIASQVAQCLVIPTGLVVIEDHGEAYDAKPDLFEFISKLPVTWDQSKVLNAEIGKYLTVARQNGRQWFIGSLTNEQGRKLEIPLDFLDKNTAYDMTVYEDAPDANYSDKKEAYAVRHATVGSGDVLTVTLAPGGGNAVWIRPHIKNAKN